MFFFISNVFLSDQLLGLSKSNTLEFRSHYKLQTGHQNLGFQETGLIVTMPCGKGDAPALAVKLFTDTSD